MRLENRMISRGDVIYFIDSVTDMGIINARTALGMVRRKSRPFRLDPMTYDLKLYDVEYLGFEEFSRVELLSLATLDPTLPVSRIRDCILTEENGTYLMLFKTGLSEFHVVYICAGVVYGTVVCDKNVKLEKDIYDLSSSIVSPLLEGHRLYRILRSGISGTVLSVLDKMCLGFPSGVRLRLGVYRNKEVQYAVKVRMGSGYAVIDPEEFGSEMYGLVLPSRSIGYSELLEYVSGNPLDSEEIEKIHGILENYGCCVDFFTDGYRSIVPYGNEYICLNRRTKRLYRIERAYIEPINSISGNPMYYEIRVKTLCESDDYYVAYSAFTKEECLEVLERGYFELLRPRLLQVDGYWFKCNRVSDDWTKIYFSYSTVEGTDVSTACYDKVVHRWSYEKGTSDMRKQFLEKLLCKLDETANIKNNLYTRFSVYAVVDGVTVIDVKHWLGVSPTFVGCSSIVCDADGGVGDYLIVESVGNSTGRVWMYDGERKEINQMNVTTE